MDRTSEIVFVRFGDYVVLPSLSSCTVSKILSTKVCIMGHVRRSSNPVFRRSHVFKKNGMKLSRPGILCMPVSSKQPRPISQVADVMSAFQPNQCSNYSTSHAKEYQICFRKCPRLGMLSNFPKWRLNATGPCGREAPIPAGYSRSGEYALRIPPDHGVLSLSCRL